MNAVHCQRPRASISTAQMLGAASLQHFYWGTRGNVWSLLLDIKIKRWRHFYTKFNKYKLVLVTITIRMSTAFEIAHVNSMRFVVSCENMSLRSLICCERETQLSP